MLITAIFLFIFALISGVFLGVYILFGKTYPPMGLAIAHGTLAVGALALAIAGAVGAAAATLFGFSLGSLALAALAGVFLFSCQLRGRAHPTLVVVLHALLALAGFIGFALAALMSLVK